MATNGAKKLLIATIFFKNQFVCGKVSKWFLTRRFFNDFSNSAKEAFFLGRKELSMCTSKFTVAKLPNSFSPDIFPSIRNFAISLPRIASWYLLVHLPTGWPKENSHKPTKTESEVLHSRRSKGEILGETEGRCCSFQDGLIYTIAMSEKGRSCNVVRGWDSESGNW